MTLKRGIEIPSHALQTVNFEDGISLLRWRSSPKPGTARPTETRPDTPKVRLGPPSLRRPRPDRAGSHFRLCPICNWTDGTVHQGSWTYVDILHTRI